MNSATMARLREPERAGRGVTPWDPSAVFLVKTLLYPTVATGCLGLALWICGAPFRHEYFLIGVLAFLATAEVLDTAPLEYAASRSALHRGLIPIAVQWLIVVAFIWALLEVSDLTGHFDPDALVTWAAITPLALWSSRLGARSLTRTAWR